MASKKSKNKKPAKTFESQEKKRMRTLQIVFMAFSVILILSMMLSLATK
jgi:predicted nucleic acid-binding Zn ribbon protein